MSLYTPSHAAALISKIPEMMAEAESLRSDHVAPTLKQRVAISTIIWNFVRKRQRIIYGGHALNAMLLQTSPKDAIYGQATTVAQFPDIEFYSPNPVADIVELCNLIFIDGYRYVQGREAAHSGTYTISVEFTRVCDITYVPKLANDVIPFILVSGIPMVDPAFAIIDYLKILCDPFTSYWKLDRMIPRMMLMQQLFPMNFQTKGKGNAETVTTVRTETLDVMLWVAAAPTLIAVGDHALSFFSSSNNTSNHLTVVSVNFETDVQTFYDFFKPAISKTKERHPMIDIIGRMATFYFHNKCTAVTMIDSRDKAVPVSGVYGKSHILEPPMKIASFNYCLLSAMGQHLTAVVNKCRAEADVHMNTASMLIECRRSALESSNTDTTDITSPFRDVSLVYIGEPKTAMRTHMAVTDDRRIKSAKNAQVWFSFDPSRPSHSKPSSYMYLKCDGTLVHNRGDSALKL